MRRATWVCGPERVLAEEVAAEIRAAATECLPFIAGEDSEADIWAAAGQIPSDPEAECLVIVRSAQRLRRTGLFADTVRALPELPGVRLLFMSDENDFPRVRTEDKEVLAPHIELLRDSRLGQLVRCTSASPEDDAPEWLLDWASRRLGGAGRILGSCLLERTGHDLEAAANVAGQLTASGLPVTREHIEALVQPSASFTDALVRGRREDALRAALSMSGDETGRAIGLLAYQLDVLSLLYAAAEQRLDARDIALKLGVQTFLQRRFRDVARSYPPARVQSCRTVLAVADDAWHAGAGLGVAEFVAVLWDA